MDNLIEKLGQAIDKAQSIVFFGGAGVSTASGIPDFRSAKGLYNQTSGYNCSAEKIISHSFYESYPDLFFDYYRKHLVYPEAQPNVAHEYLAKLEASGKMVTVITQNIDGLHQQAGSKMVLELHGSVWRNYCQECGQTYDLAELTLDESGIPRCPKDRGIVRPDVVLYEEGLDQETLVLAVASLSRADLVIVAGTSLIVYPAAGLVNYYQGDQLYVINKTLVPMHGRTANFIQAPIEEVFGQLMKKID